MTEMLKFLKKVLLKKNKWLTCIHKVRTHKILRKCDITKQIWYVLQIEFSTVKNINTNTIYIYEYAEDGHT